MKKRLLAGIWFFFFLFSCKTSEQDQAKKKDGDETLFRKPILSIDQISLTNEDLKNFIKIQYPDLVEKKDDQKMLSRLFDIFVKHQIVLYKADEEKLTVSDDEYANYLKTAEITKNGNATERRSIEDLIKVQKYLMLEVYKDITVSEKEIEDYYQAHIENYRKKDEIYLHQVLIDNRDKAIRIRGELVEFAR